MTLEARSRSPAETLALARVAAARAGVTRVSDITAFAVPGIHVFQATRPDTRSLSVSQGKGLTPTAAIVGALLESVEMWSAERLVRPADTRPLAALTARESKIWSGERGPLAIDLDPALPRGWLAGRDLHSGEACAMPWDLLSLDITRPTLEIAGNSNGLACGNTRSEALVSGLSQLLEHDCVARFALLAQMEKLACQIALDSIEDPLIVALMRRIERAGFELRAWSQGGESGLAAIEVAMFDTTADLHWLAPVAGNGCHPSARTAFVRALLEAVQTHAALVAGARDDLSPGDYGLGRERRAAMLFEALAYADGPLDWRGVPTVDCPTSEHCLDFLLAAVERITGLPAIAFEHDPPCPGLDVVHVLAPGLMDPRRRRETPPAAASGKRAVARAASPRARRKVLFAGPSIAGLIIPDGVEVRPPARCGDLAALLDQPPDAIALVDGVFKIAPTVWHKEIMALLALGTRVIGGASLGALRAAELERFGMEGVGAIFHGYRSGLMVRDDAVMLVHAPAELGYAPLSLSLVEAEHALSLADLPPRALRTMQRILRRAPFETRNWRDGLAEYHARTGEAFPLPAEALEAAPSLKRSDAQLVIQELVALRAAGRPAGLPPMPPLTLHFRALLARTAPAFAVSPA